MKRSLLVALNLHAQEPTIENFELLTGCEPMILVVEELPQDAAQIGLTKRSITTLVRSRLRAARIYDSDQQPRYLYVNVNVAGQGLSIDVHFNKWLCDPVTELCGTATTWNAGNTGTHGRNYQYILQGISRHTDRFIDEYLAVNGDYCE